MTILNVLKLCEYRSSISHQVISQPHLIFIGVLLHRNYEIIAFRLPHCTPPRAFLKWITLYIQQRGGSANRLNPSPTQRPSVRRIIYLHTINARTRTQANQPDTTHSITCERGRASAKFHILTLTTLSPAGAQHVGHHRTSHTLSLSLRTRCEMRKCAPSIIHCGVDIIRTCISFAGCVCVCVVHAIVTEHGVRVRWGALASAARLIQNCLL